MSRREIPIGWRAAVLLAAVFSASAAFADQEAAAPAELDRRPGAGEQCIVCGRAIEGLEIVEIRYKGRVFHVAAKMLGDFEGDPDAYFQQLQARSALFDEGAMAGRRTSKGWLYFGTYVLVGLVFAALCGYLAVSRSLKPLPWFFAGLAGNVAALVVLLAVRRGDASSLPAGHPVRRHLPGDHRPRHLPCPESGARHRPARQPAQARGAGGGAGRGLPHALLAVEILG